jgi:hypothetical protein
MDKLTILVPNRSYTSSADGRLPKVAVSVSRPPWIKEEKEEGDKK